VKGIANGELSRKIDVFRDDEIGELGKALNQLTEHIKDNMDELKIYGERTKLINLQINKQVVVLSGLFEISNLITKNATLKDIFQITMSRLSQIANSSIAFVIFKTGDTFDIAAHYGLGVDVLGALKMPVNAYMLTPLLSLDTYLKSDNSSPPENRKAELLKLLNAKNILIQPVVVQHMAIGVLGVGNSLDNFRYTDEDVELTSVFVKQLAIAVENDFLSKKVKDLEIKDELTDLYNKRFIFSRLDEEILRAISKQRPCGLAVFSIVNLSGLKLQYGDVVVDDILKKSADVLKVSCSEMDKVGRIGDNEFGMILPEKNKRQAHDFATKILEKIQDVFVIEEGTKRPLFDLVIVENPIDGVDAKALFEKIKISVAA
jgi:diguanylate cyclase (GGDEF)-like protein